MNYLKICFRTLMRQKTYSMITVFGLAVGLGVFILTWITSNMAFTADKFHKNVDRLFCVIQVLPSGNEGEQHVAKTPARLLNAVMQQIPEVKEGVRFFRADRMIMGHDEERFYEDDVLFADPNFLSVFSFRTIVGDVATMLSEPNAIVLTEESALKYFGNTNPLGQSLKLNNHVDVFVTGVVEKAPLNSSITYDFIVSMETARQFYDWMDNWKVNSQATFLFLPKESLLQDVEIQLSRLIDMYYEDTPEKPKRMYLFPLGDFFLKSIGIDSFMNRNFGIVYYLLLISGIVLLIIVSLNFMSLLTARYTTRVREVGVRKVVGANRIHLITQFLSESILLVLLALPIGIFLYQLMSNFLSGYLWRGTQISIWRSPQHLVFLFLIMILLGLFSGSYPAFFLSSFRPVTVLKKEVVSDKKRSSFRKMLVVSQFAFSTILIVFAIVVNRQFDHILTTDFGYNRERIIAVPLSIEAKGRLELMQTEILKYPDVVSVSASVSLPGVWNDEEQVVPEGIDASEAWTMNVYGVDYGFTELYNMEIIRGRSLSREYEDKKHFLINETAVRQLGWKDPIGKRMIMGNREGTICGVVKDFLFKDVHFAISPSVLYLAEENRDFLLVKYSSHARLTDVITYLERSWEHFVPDLPFEYTIHQKYFHDTYQGINTIAMLCGSIGIIGIFFSCLGIMALSTYAVERRTKEIGIRKTLGASALSIVRLLMKDFLTLVVVANVIGLPIVYFLSRYFIQWGFPEYHIGTETWIFLLIPLLTSIAAIIAMIYQTMKAAYSNPTDSLRYE